MKNIRSGTRDSAINARSGRALAHSPWILLLLLFLYSRSEIAWGQPQAPATPTIPASAPSFPGLMGGELVAFRRSAEVPANESDIAELRRIVESAHNTARPGSVPSAATVRAQVADLEDYLTKYTDSPYNPSVRQNLAQWYSGHGHYEKARRHGPITGRK